MALGDRRPEQDLTVLWQRHVPEGYGVEDGTLRMAAFRNLGDEAIFALQDMIDELDRGDIVLLIARRPPLGRSQP